jgi:hypothetical protein
VFPRAALRRRFLVTIRLALIGEPLRLVVESLQRFLKLPAGFVRQKSALQQSLNRKIRVRQVQQLFTHRSAFDAQLSVSLNVA